MYVSFLRDVRKAVGDELGAAPAKGDPRLHRKAALILLWYAASLAGLLTAPDFPLRLAAALSFAGASTAIGFNIFHDANHGSFGKSRAVNTAVSVFCSVLIGPARRIWRVKHNILHHLHPNVGAVDDDLDGRGLLRFAPTVPWKPNYRRQQMTAPFLYALNTIEWIFIKDFVRYFSGRMNAHRPLPPMRLADHAEFWLSKLAYGAIVVAPPFFVMPAVEAALCFFAFHAVFGLSVCLVFLPSHLTHDMAFWEKETGEDVARQLLATANYGVGDPLTTWFTGGINLQIEHHLFPHLSHVHYASIAPVVERVAGAHGLPYLRLGGFGEAVARHFSFLREMGRRPAPAAA
ncbi:MAG: acyl-CoA desaturase [Parvularculaceae bacterium]